jgi:hypothetical protein
MLRDLAEGLTPLSSVRLTWCPREIQMQYQIAASVAEDDIRQRGFEVLSSDNRFIDRPAVDVERPGDRPDDHLWWRREPMRCRFVLARAREDTT